jgi:hypothetical protein
MKKPEELIELIEALRSEVARPSAAFDTGARVTVFIEKGHLNLTAADAIYLLHSESTVARFFDALGCPDDTGIEIHSFEIEDEVKSALEARFSTVDEL